jgi:hypothetical protein
MKKIQKKARQDGGKIIKDGDDSQPGRSKGNKIKEEDSSKIFLI